MQLLLWGTGTLNQRAIKYDERVLSLGDSHDDFSTPLMLSVSNEHFSSPFFFRSSGHDSHGSTETVGMPRATGSSNIHSPSPLAQSSSSSHPQPSSLSASNSTVSTSSSYNYGGAGSLSSSSVTFGQNDSDFEDGPDWRSLLKPEELAKLNKKEQKRQDVLNG